ncbi:alpha/beta hydrolase [Rhodococcus sp. G-MC3]|uniref:alpha/beta hydrolase family protein n=1 Tax=Rhodococcus sp. G-MC3 TaxID=3046209 RepID=UPI0024BB7614|nr:alpha/beta hydrolase [Rhodococcus sp. G-MC3]MDJ0396061.1 alpha/beta hydrolase [Rhodococcus sp. G-MC3]
MDAPSTRITIVVNPSTVRDRRTAEDLVDRASARRNLTADVFWSDTVPDGHFDGEIIVVPAGPFDASELKHGVVRVDFGQCPADRSDGVHVHIRGRGLEGLRFAIESLYHRRFHPATEIHYGEHPEQRIEVRLPDGNDHCPTAVLVHGGYWRSRWALDLMDALAVDLTARGYATWNVEYRRPDEHDWAATTSDIASAMTVVQNAPQTLDSDRVVMFGHSAGGQLVTRLAADAPEMASVTVSLAGVLDLRLADERWLSEGAVASALGGRADNLADLYDRSSPIERVPNAGSTIVVCAVDDDPNLLEMTRAYAAADSSVTLVEGPGGHFHVVDPTSEIWARVMTEVDVRMRPR